MDQIAETLLHYCNIAVLKCQQISPRVIEFYDFTFVLEGELVYYANGERICLQKNDAVFLAPGTLRQRVAGQTPVRYVSFNFLPCESVTLSFPPQMKNCITREIAVAAMNFPTEHVVPNTQSRAKCLHLLNYILCCLFDTAQRITQNEHVINMLCYIESHLSEKISLCDVSKHVGLSREYTASLFKREMGKTVTGYICEQKLLLAKGMILGGELSLLDISEKLGFENYNYFSRSFKRYFGITPIRMK